MYVSQRVTTSQIQELAVRLRNSLSDASLANPVEWADADPGSGTWSEIRGTWGELLDLLAMGDLSPLQKPLHPVLHPVTADYGPDRFDLADVLFALPDEIERWKEALR